ncbi:VRR-NUC domain-containing protein [Luteolibacter pohnpeiensis]|uniref:VRR-NUC domain-containing protein n=1 Tax=Luteolibacter pohnpeiensis TaxID=454153 RepID=A0A934S8E8_9BACT|nr:VRR-NUC domain-containing protein [Luteolibacter pohnpeiensis]MBK1884666.1 VRR-NUC domain-containing protein [Luteolibacter pohnpeiensis]
MLFVAEAPEILLMYAIPNGDWRGFSVAKKLKAEGLNPGIPDIHVPVARSRYIGLYIEFKRAGGPVKEEQWEKIHALTEQGHLAILCDSAVVALKILRKYLKGEIE